MPQTLTKCACSTSGTANGTEIVPGLAEADLSTIHLTQGVPWTWRQCFVKQLKPPIAILEERVGGQLIMNKTDHCFVATDVIRLINYGPCTPDTDDATSVFTVASVATDPGNANQDVVTVTGLTTINKVYQAVTAASSMVPIGCAVDAATTATNAPPYALEVCDGAPLFISGGIFARDDYYQMFAVSATAGSPILYSTELGKVQPGDWIKSVPLGFSAPVKVMRVDSETVQDSSTGARMQRDKITVSANSTATNSCAAIMVTRGLIAPLTVRQSGRCWELSILGNHTSALQLHPKMKKGDAYDVGTLTVTAFFGTLVAGNLVVRGVELLRSNVMLKPSHMGVI